MSNKKRDALAIAIVRASLDHDNIEFVMAVAATARAIADAVMRGTPTHEVGRTAEDQALAKRAESAELGCEIAYRREPTQAEGDAHADGADECFVAMGGWTGRRCRACGRWVWGGPTACDRCVCR